MRIVAVMACRNEALYLPTCLHHLVSQGVEFAIVDNGSTDESLDIAHSAEFKPHLAHLKSVPFNGVFELDTMLRAKMVAGEQVKTDWLINMCPDELLHSNRQGVTLAEEIAQFDRAGFNVINFDEFVFLPIEQDWQEGFRGWPSIPYYYFFEPSRFRQMRAWKNRLGLTNINYGGHRLSGDKLFAPESLVLRHYPFRNQQHAFEKYASRNFSKQELARGWHRNRTVYPRKNYAFPPSEKLEALPYPASFALSRAHPWNKHYWEY